MTPSKILSSIIFVTSDFTLRILKNHKKKKMFSEKMLSMLSVGLGESKYCTDILLIVQIILFTPKYFIVLLKLLIIIKKKN